MQVSIGPIYNINGKLLSASQPEHANVGSQCMHAEADNFCTATLTKTERIILRAI